MKKNTVITSIIILTAVLLSVITSSCDKDNYRVKKVRIKGKINKDKGVSTKSTDNEYTLADADKVLIFYGREYDIANIQNDGSFSGSAALGSATALAFLTEDNQFIGNLFVGGMNFIPLLSDNGDLSEIDLSELILDGYQVIPANDPINNQIILSATELQFMQEVGSYYSALSKNLDMNNDATPDILQNGKIDITFGSSIVGGIWGLNTTEPTVIPIDISSVSYSIFIEGSIDWLSSNDNSLPENAWLSGPAENPNADIQSSGGSYSNGENFKIQFEGQGNSNLIFSPGLYALHIDNKEFTFHYSNINSINYRVVAIPTLITNSSNQVTQIQFTYLFPDGTVADPRKLMMSGIDINISNNSNYILQAMSSSHASTDYDYDYYNYNLDNPINLSEISTIDLIYIDIFGNSCKNSWFAVVD